jgi:peptidoglycan-associated lipoprotein
MSFFNKKSLFATILSVAMISGCSNTATKSGSETAAPPAQTPTATDNTAAKTTPAEDQAAITAKKLAEQQAQAKAEAAKVKEKEQAALREVRTFYFDFDKSDLKPESRMPLLAHAAYLAANPTMKVTLQGYCDERGTREYNLALGERRAKAVERFLVINGVSRDQITVISYGEEKPVALGHNEAAWAKNRRVVIVYK